MKECPDGQFFNTANNICEIFCQNETKLDAKTQKCILSCNAGDKEVDGKCVPVIKPDETRCERGFKLNTFKNKCEPDFNLNLDECPPNFSKNGDGNCEKWNAKKGR